MTVSVVHTVAASHHSPNSATIPTTASADAVRGQRDLGAEPQERALFPTASAARRLPPATAAAGLPARLRALDSAVGRCELHAGIGSRRGLHRRARHVTGRVGIRVGLGELGDEETLE